MVKIKSEKKNETTATDANCQSVRHELVVPGKSVARNAGPRANTMDRDDDCG